MVIILPLFNKKQVELYDYTESTEYNVYGEPKEEYTYIGTYQCDFQPLSPSATLKQYGKILTDTYKIYLNINTPINDKTILRIKGGKDTYELVGSPEYHTNILPHIKLQVKKTRKPLIND